MQVEMTDLLWLAAQLYNDPELKEGFMAEYRELHNDMERQYRELNTGQWWGLTEADVHEKHPVSGDAALCCVMLRYVAFCCVMLRCVTLC